MVDFLTVEDINSVVAEYYNVPFWDSVEIGTGESVVDFTGIKFDYCTVDREYTNGAYEFSISVDNDLFGMYTSQYGYVNLYAYFKDNNNEWIDNVTNDHTNKIFTIQSSTPSITCNFLLNPTEYVGQVTYFSNQYYWRITKIEHQMVNKKKPEFKIYLECLDENEEINGVRFSIDVDTNFVESVICNNGVLTFTPHNNLQKGLHKLSVKIPSETVYYVYWYFHVPSLNVVALPSSLDLLVGRVNSFTLVSDSSNLSVESNYPVTISGKNVTLDLTGVYDIGNVDLTVRTVEDSSYYPNEWQFKIPTSYPVITTEAGLTSLFSSGGVGRLGADLTLTDDLTLTKDVLLIGEDKTLNLGSFGQDNHYKIIVPSNKTFKAENTVFTGGKHTIHQNKDSTVELTDCTFTGCLADNGHGSVIDCSVDLESLSVPMDFTTVMTGCTISNSDMAILHGGDLTVTDCQVTGKINEPSYPYFLYQTDGTAVITQSQFNIESDSQIESDIEFNSCIFTCGNDALINNLTHEELSNNNITRFLTDARNSSSIDLTYYYDAIEDYITLQGSGYCHSVSGTDFVFKTNITPRRVE